MIDTSYRRTAALALFCTWGLVSGALAADPVGAIEALRTPAEVTALVEAARTGSPAERVKALEVGLGMMRKDFKAAVAECLRHADPQVRRAALGAVLPCRVRAGYPTLAEALAEEFHTYRADGFTEDVLEGELEIRYSGRFIAAFRLMGRAALPAAVAKLKSDNSVDRYVAVSVLGAMGYAEVVDDVAPLLADRERSVRLRAARSLGRIGGRKALDALAASIKAADDAHVRAVAVAMAEAGDPRAIALWERLLFNSRTDLICVGAGPWIEKLPFHQAVSLLVRALSHKDPIVRYSCHDALRRLTCHDFGFFSGKGGTDNPPLRRAAATRWEAWWKKVQSRPKYEILLLSLTHKPMSRIGMDAKGSGLLRLTELGDTRAIPRLIELYDAGVEAHSYNEKADVDSALRLLAGRCFDGKAAWQRWYEQAKATLPARSVLSGPSQPLRCVAKLSICHGAERISVDGGLAFISGNCTAIDVVDVSDPVDPELIARYRLRDGYSGVDQLLARRGRLYFTTHAGGFHVYDYNRQGELTHVFSDQEARRPGHFICRGNRLILGGLKKVLLYDIGGEGPPRVIDRREAKELREYCVNDSDGFFTTARWDGDRIVTDGAVRIAAKHRVWPQGTAQGDGERFYCLDHSVMYIHDLRTGELLGRTPARARYDATLRIHSGRAYAWLDDLGLVVYDISDPADVRILSHTPMPGVSGDQHWRGLQVYGEHLFSVNYHGEMWVFELPEPLQPN